LWRPTSPEDVLICLNAPFMTQHILKSWCQWTYQNSAVKRASVRVVPGWVTSWEVWFGGVKSGQYCAIGGMLLQMVSKPLPSLRWWERAQAQCRMPAGTLGPKIGWLWRPTSPGNEDVCICLNAPFITQRVLKPWWQWTYQNSAAKRASMRVVPGWVTSWEVWFGGAKSRQYCVIGGGSLQYCLLIPLYRVLLNYYFFSIEFQVIFCFVGDINILESLLVSSLKNWIDF